MSKTLKKPTRALNQEPKPNTAKTRRIITSLVTETWDGREHILPQNMTREEVIECLLESMPAVAYSRMQLQEKLSGKRKRITFSYSPDPAWVQQLRFCSKEEIAKMIWERSERLLNDRYNRKLGTQPPHPDDANRPKKNKAILRVARPIQADQRRLRPTRKVTDEEIKQANKKTRREKRQLAERKANRKKTVKRLTTKNWLATIKAFNASLDATTLIDTNGRSSTMV